MLSSAATPPRALRTAEARAPRVRATRYAAEHVTRAYATVT
jgi:hypothetical protein